ncbi:MAG: hypothetical protein U1F41_02305 [Burkholderiales bacterium]
MDAANILPVVGLLVLAAVVVVVLLRAMRARHRNDDPRLDDATVHAPPPAARPSNLSKEEQDYLDSSHISGPIVPGARDALETWRSNKRN